MYHMFKIYIDLVLISLIKLEPNNYVYSGHTGVQGEDYLNINISVDIFSYRDTEVVLILFFLCIF